MANPKVREKIQSNRLYDEMKQNEGAQMLFSNGSFTNQLKAPFKDIQEELLLAKESRTKSTKRPPGGGEKQSEFSELPDFLAMSKL